MKDAFSLIIYNIPALICYSVSAYLLIHDKYGWGWFLLVALICTHVSHGSNNTSDQKVVPKLIIIVP